MDSATIVRPIVLVRAGWSEQASQSLNGHTPEGVFVTTPPVFRHDENTFRTLGGQDVIVLSWRIDVRSYRDEKKK